MRSVLRDEQVADVPCGDCVGCCVSSYPIPLRPSDAVARARVLPQFLIKPDLMGFRDDGSCPFLEQRCCSIYADRPQTCRDYDCRIFAAAGLEPAGDRPVIRDRVRAWRFSYPLLQDVQEADAVRKAVEFIDAHRAEFPDSMRVGSPTARAVLAIKSFEVFLLTNSTTSYRDAEVAYQVARVIAAVRAFDARE